MNRNLKILDYEQKSENFYSVFYSMWVLSINKNVYDLIILRLSMVKKSVYMLLFVNF